jgi:hypothetical protein
MNAIEKLNVIEKEEVYKLICTMHNHYPSIPKKKLLEMWCKRGMSISSDMPRSSFDDLMELSYVPCPSCQKMQLVDDAWNFHCRHCPHYNGPAQCVFFCCMNY